VEASSETVYIEELNGLMNKAVFLDRDGVINEIVFHQDVEILDSPFNIQQVRILQGVFPAITTFNKLGFKVLVVTNQPGAAKGKMSLARIGEINQHVVNLASKNRAQIDQVYCCPHHPIGNLRGDPSLIKPCKCRKPGIDLLSAGVDDHKINIKLSYMVGDSISDIQAGKDMGLKTVLVGGLKCDARRLYEEKDCLPDFIYQSLASFAKSLKPEDVQT
jgi:D-glycero-D-manno-heptose 1,7-bisphosphate phosphatase